MEIKESFYHDLAPSTHPKISPAESRIAELERSAELLQDEITRLKNKLVEKEKTIEGVCLKSLCFSQKYLEALNESREKERVGTVLMKKVTKYKEKSMELEKKVENYKSMVNSSIKSKQSLEANFVAEKELLKSNQDTALTKLSRLENICNDAMKERQSNEQDSILERMMKEIIGIKALLSDSNN